MSKIKKTVCDCCNKILQEGEKYYNADINRLYEDEETGKMILQRGDYCEQCFRQAISNELKQ